MQTEINPPPEEPLGKLHSPAAFPPSSAPTKAPQGHGERPCPAHAHLKPLAILIWPVIALAAFCLSFAWNWSAPLVVVYLFALVQMAQAETWRKSFYPGLGAGLMIGILQLEFFWRIFAGGAAALWLVYAFWIALFVALARLCLRLQFQKPRRSWVGWMLLPFLWCGLEYFRSELYYLRFSWLSPGFAFGSMPGLAPFHSFGSYGTGFLAMCLASLSGLAWRNSRSKGLVVLLCGTGTMPLLAWLLAPQPERVPHQVVSVAGVQMEFPTEKEVLVRLDSALKKAPGAQLFVLSEYTFSEPIPETVRAWCKRNGKYLVAGGKDPVAPKNFYNTAFVVSPAGEIVFRQVKSVPIQFFKDGLPAPEQKVWESPWGKIGICICYDLSYRRVTDRLVSLGAEALVVPTMDVVDWGERQHQLHARVAPVRAAEYGIPIFRLASSGVSQLTDTGGRVIADAPCPGDGALIAGTLALDGPGHVPLDRYLAPVSTAITLLLLGAFSLRALRRAVPIQKSRPRAT